MGLLPGLARFTCLPGAETAAGMARLLRRISSREDGVGSYSRFVWLARIASAETPSRSFSFKIMISKRR